MIDFTARPAAKAPVPRWVLPLLPLIGALIAAMTGLLAAALVTLGGGLFGWLTFLLAPSSGLPVAALVAHRRGTRLDINGVGLTLLGGMIAAGVLSYSFATSR